MREYRRSERAKRQASAHQKVYMAIKRGDIQKEPCETCGEENVHAHHYDYEKPLDVSWLCPKHHSLLHHGL